MFQRFGAHRRAHHVALHRVAAAVGKVDQLVLLFDAFRHHRSPRLCASEMMASTMERRRWHRWRCRRRRPVDFQHVDREALQVGQRWSIRSRSRRSDTCTPSRLSRPAYPACSTSAIIRLSVISISSSDGAQPGALQPRPIWSATSRYLRNCWADRLTAMRSTVQPLRARPLGCLRRRLQHPVAQRHDQAESPRRCGMKLSDTSGPAAPAASAAAPRRRRCDRSPVHLRLVVQAQIPGLQRTPAGRFPGAAGASPRIHSRPCRMRTVAAPFLGPVHRDVGALDQRDAVVAVVRDRRRCRRCADREGFRPRVERRATTSSSCCIRPIDRLPVTPVRQHQHELVAAQPRDGVAAAAVVLDAARPRPSAAGRPTRGPGCR